MKKKLKSLVLFCYQNKWIKWVIIPFILFIFWVACSLLFSSYINILTLTQKYNNNSIIQAPKEKLVKGTSITGEFKASENNLGILSIRFAQHKQIDYDNQDKIIFRIKEKDQKIWWYQRVYETGGIYELPFYPFGFPVVSNSKGKTFVFSITSLKGNNENALQLSNIEPVLESKYVVSKNDLLVNKKNLIHFMYIKLINAFTDSDFLYSSIIYILPLVLYLLRFWISSRLRSDSYSFLFVTPLIIFMGISLMIGSTTVFVLTMVGFWLITIKIYSIESSISYLFAFFFLFLALIAVLFGDQNIAGNLSNWTYIFLIIGTVQLLIEFKIPNEKRLIYSELFDDSLFVKNSIRKVKKFFIK